MKFCGAKIYCVSNPGDILTIVTPENSSIYFDDSKVSRTQAVQNIKQALIDYVRGSSTTDTSSTRRSSTSSSRPRG